MNIIEFIEDPNFIAGQLSPFQETALRLLYGLPLSVEQLEIARLALDVEEIVDREYGETTIIAGRRSGKTDRVAANVVVFESTMGGHEHYLSSGERGNCVLVAQDTRAAKVAYRYVLGKLEGSPVLREMIANVTAEEIELTNGIVISIFPCSFRALRGFSIPVAALDEFAFFKVEGVNVDRAVVDSIRPAMVQFPRSKLIKVSSPYSKTGELYRDFSTRHARPDLLCFRASSQQMNPSLRQSFLDSEQRRDPEFFEREYLAQFTDSLSNAFDREAVQSVVIPGRRELPRVHRINYVAGVDPSGGGADEFTLSIAHEHNGRVIQDCLRAQRSRRPADVVGEMAKTLAAYGVHHVHGDRYSGEWVRQEFQKHGIQYEVSDITASEAFLELLPLINQGSIELLDDPQQTMQLIALERRKSRNAKDSLGHPAGGHDDRPNSLAIAAFYCQAAKVGNRWGGIF